MANYSKEADILLFGLVDAFNKLHDAFTAKDGYDVWHRDVTAIVTGDFRSPVVSALQITAPTAIDLASCSVLGNQVWGALNVHFQDDSAHLKVDAVSDGYLQDSSATLPLDGQTLVQVMNQVNVCKIAFNEHLTQSGVHVVDDTVNTVVASDATDLASAETLANALKTAFNAHVLGGPLMNSVIVPRVKPVNS